MKKITPNPPETDTPSEPETLDLTQLSQATQRAVSARLRNPKQPDPVSHVFSQVPYLWIWNVANAPARSGIPLGPRQFFSAPAAIQCAIRA